MSTILLKTPGPGLARIAASCMIISMLPAIAYVMYGLEEPEMFMMGTILAVFAMMWIAFDTPPLLERQVLRMPVVALFFTSLMLTGAAQ